LIEGELIRLRAVEKEDLKRFRDWRNDPDVKKFTREYRVLSMQNQMQWLDFLARNKNTIMFAVETKKGKLIGCTGLTYIDWKNRGAEVSIYIGDKKYKGKGYGTDTLKTLMKYGFEGLNLHMLFGEIFEYNKANIRLFEKCGFKRDGVLRHRLYRDGKYWNSIFYSILKREWQQTNQK
jgi:UDP-4-amino-4,6-dideoxy-N-acetyl-beta-L-altrosamine N-acetyltransferase